MAKDDRKHIIEVRDLVKRYRNAEVNAVDGVSFYVEEGSFFSLLGPNGAGKTTILSILITLLSKSSGEATVAGYDVEEEPGLVRTHIGVIFQNASLDVHLTAEENVRFHANLYGLYPYRPTFSLMDVDYQERVMELAEIVGITGEMHKPVKAFSGGMKRKLEIIRSLMHKPEVLFLDEPTTGLDPISRTNLWQYLKRVRREERTTIFLTTHYLEEAEGADYLCIIDRGKLIAKGMPEEVKEVLVDRYVEVDAAERTRLAAELKKRGLKFTGKGPFRVAMNGVSVAQVIQQTKTPLTRVKVYSPTLEQAYVKIIEEQDV